MVTKLKFKGEKTKKRKRTYDDPESQGTSTRDDADDQGWVDAASLEDISTGPLFITFNSSPPVALASDPLGKIFASALKVKYEEDVEFSNVEPDDVRQVWIATRLAESSKISLKTATGKFLSCDKIGLLSASKEAIGPQEEWQLVRRDDGWTFQNVFDKFLYSHLLPGLLISGPSTRLLLEVKLRYEAMRNQ
jgi:protein FRG1